MGGAENLLLQIIKNLDKRKYKIYLAVHKKEGKLLPKYEELDIEITAFPKKKYFFKSAYLFYIFLKEKKIDCIHIHLVSTFFFAISVAKLVGIKNIIVHWHNVYGQKRHDKLNFIRRKYKVTRGIFLLKYSYIFSNNIIAISEQVKIHNCLKFNLSTRKVILIYNAIDSSLIPKNKLSERNSFLIGTIGKVTEQKGYDTLLKAMRIVVNWNPNIHLEVIGDLKAKGTEIYGDKILKLRKNLNLDNNVNFIGSINYDKVFERLYSWSVFVLASKWEGFGLVLIEAMATETPVIANNIDAIPEIINNNDSGVLFKKNDPYDLAKQIIWLLKNKDISDSIAKSGKLQVQSKFSINRMINELDIVYSKNY